MIRIQQELFNFLRLHCEYGGEITGSSSSNNRVTTVPVTKPTTAYVIVMTMSIFATFCNTSYYKQ